MLGAATAARTELEHKIGDEQGDGGDSDTEDVETLKKRMSDNDAAIAELKRKLAERKKRERESVSRTTVTMDSSSFQQIMDEKRRSGVGEKNDA